MEQKTLGYLKLGSSLAVLGGIHAYQYSKSESKSLSGYFQSEKRDLTISASVVVGSKLSGITTGYKHLDNALIATASAAAQEFAEFLITPSTKYEFDALDTALDFMGALAGSYLFDVIDDFFPVIKP